MTNNDLKQLKLTNYNIERGINKWDKEFFKIVDSDSNTYYFCFYGIVKEGWDLLKDGSLSGEINIDYKEKKESDSTFRHVVHIYQELI